MSAAPKEHAKEMIEPKLLARAEIEAGGGLRRPPLRITTSGSVDDGKSTLIGRLLYDADAVPADQLEAIERVSRQRGLTGADLSLLTDGLRAEREQGITIDVAYRYFGTATRRYIIADAPGHAQYTRNMATAASVADLAIILIDARLGVTEQTRRHTLIASLMRAPNVVVAVNKIDLVGYERGVYERVMGEFHVAAAELGLGEVRALPVSALNGDNVVHRGTGAAWYQGPTLLEILESTEARREAAGPLRLPVQSVIRPRDDAHHDFRGYAGAIAAGRAAAGDAVVVLPAGHVTRIASVHLGARTLDGAEAPRSVAVTLVDDVDVTRGDTIASVGDRPSISRVFTADVVWMDSKPLAAGGRYLIQHGPHRVKAIAERIMDRVDLGTLRRADAAGLELNDIGRVRWRTSEPLVFDPYERSRATGSFIIIDQASAGTHGAGLMVGAAEDEEG